MVPDGSWSVLMVPGGFDGSGWVLVGRWHCSLTSVYTMVVNDM